MQIKSSIERTYFCVYKVRGRYFSISDVNLTNVRLHNPRKPNMLASSYMLIKFDIARIYNGLAGTALHGASTCSSSSRCVRRHAKDKFVTTCNGDNFLSFCKVRTKLLLLIDINILKFTLVMVNKVASSLIAKVIFNVLSYTKQETPSAKFFIRLIHQKTKPYPTNLHTSPHVNDLSPYLY